MYRNNFSVCLDPDQPFPSLRTSCWSAVRTLLKLVTRSSVLISWPQPQVIAVEASSAIGINYKESPSEPPKWLQIAWGKKGKTTEDDFKQKSEARFSFFFHHRTVPGLHRRRLMRLRSLAIRLHLSILFPEKPNKNNIPTQHLPTSRTEVYKLPSFHPGQRRHRNREVTILKVAHFSDSIPNAKS